MSFIKTKRQMIRLDQDKHLLLKGIFLKCKKGGSKKLFYTKHSILIKFLVLVVTKNNLLGTNLGTLSPETVTWNTKPPHTKTVTQNKPFHQIM